ncbi:replication-associated recombination protein A [Devriesea agamarum]|uniref:replication-associated recombination protein A n=1 Tax=Devriesea agamarum TaxID=472569 RepID=UPI00071D2F77|nr:replication-associated recombination protein A [Devriesea agamarum]
MDEDLFTAADRDASLPSGVHTLADSTAHRPPLAVRMRPRSLEEVVGQRAALAPASPLRRLVTSGEVDGRTVPSSVILWGPPGTGKTTLAYVIARSSDREFVELSAVLAGVKEVRDVVDSARSRLRTTGRETVLFVDEVHRFSKSQQDALLPSVENRWVTLIAATTENPHFSVISPLLSRSILLTLESLSVEDLTTLVDRALSDERGLAGEVELTDDAREELLRLGSGDARKILTSLEVAAGAAIDRGDRRIDTDTLAQAINRAALRYDRDGDQHYDVVSAFIKSMRGSDVDAALHYLARMIEAGEDPRFIARRILIAASEEVSMADPSALQTAVAAAHAVQFLGMPEARITLAQAVVHIATAPKSNAAYMALERAVSDVRAGRGGPVPPALRDAHYRGAKDLGHGKDYRYAHDCPHAIATQQYPPDDLVGVDYYQPSDRGKERDISRRLPALRKIVRGPGSST